MHQFSIDNAGEVLAVLCAAFGADPSGADDDSHPSIAGGAHSSTAGEVPSSAAGAGPVSLPVGVPSDRELLGWVVSATQFTDRLEALTLALIGEAV